MNIYLDSRRPEFFKCPRYLSRGESNLHWSGMVWKLDFDFIRRAILLRKDDKIVTIVLFDELVRRIKGTHNFFVLYYEAEDDIDFEKVGNMKVVLEQEDSRINGELLYIYLNGNYLSFNDIVIYVVDPRIICYNSDFVSREAELAEKGYVVNVWSGYKEIETTLGYVMEFNKNQVNVLYPRTQQLDNIRYDDYWYLDEVVRDVMMVAIVDDVEFKVYRVMSDILKQEYMGALWINGELVSPDDSNKWYLKKGYDYFIVSQDAKVLRSKLGKIEYGLPLKRLYIR